MSLTQRVQQFITKIGTDHMMAVTKYSDLRVVEQLIEAGVKHLGENRLQDIQSKYNPQLLDEMKDAGVSLHFIGHLQSNKVAKVLQFCDQVDSVDSLKLASKINQVATEMSKVVPILLQLNLSEEEQKSGLAEAELSQLIEQVHQLPCIDLRGLMCIGKQDEPDETRKIFRRCKQLADAHGLAEVSMGMSQDYEIALEEGASMVRLGRVLVEA